MTSFFSKRSRPHRRRRLRLAPLGAVSLGLFLCALMAPRGWAQEQEPEDLFEVKPEKVRADLEKYSAQIDEHLLANRVGPARQVLDLVEDRLEKHRKMFLRGERDDYDTYVAAARQTISLKVDSLVRVAIEMLEQNGAVEAIEFRAGLVTIVGLSEAELAPLDDAIVRFGPSVKQEERRQQEVRERARLLVEKGVEPLEIDDDEVQAVAERMSLARQDSIAAEEARQDSITRVEAENRRMVAELEENRQLARTTMYKIERMMEEGNVGEAYTVFGIYEANLKQYLHPQTFAHFKGAVEAAYAGFQERSRWASRRAEELFALVGQENARDAHLGFEKDRDALKRLLDEEAFATLEADVMRAYHAWRTNVEEAESHVERINTLIGEHKADKAHKVFQRNRGSLEKYLQPSVFEELGARLDTAYREVLGKKEWARVCARDIELLVEERKGAAAHRRFEEFHEDLQLYLEPHDFERLQEIVQKAYDAFTMGAAKSQTAIEKLDEFLATRQVPFAYASFNKMEDSLAHYLDEKTFEDLKARIRDAYGREEEGSASAAQLKRQVWSLVESSQGASAYDLFIKSSGTLKEYLKPREYEALEQAAIDANTDFAKNRSVARVEAQNIRALVSQNRIDDAHDELVRSREHLKHYLDKADEYYALEQDVEKAYAALEDTRRRIQQHRKRIVLLVERDEGGEAYALYESEKADLEKYLPSADFGLLRTEVVRANVRYRDNEAKARFAATSIRTLLTKNETARAHARFAELKPNLKHYLPTDEYNILESSVQRSYGELQDRRKQAVQISRKIYALLARRDGRAANELFEEKRDELSQYLNPEDLVMLEGAVDKGVVDFRIGSDRAEETSLAIQNLLAAGEIEQAWAAFDASRVDLELFLDRESFVSLQARVEQAWAKLQDSQKQALGIAHRINALMDKKEGRAAYVLFMQSDEVLKKHLGAQSYTEIQDRATLAKADYDREQRKAEETGARVMSLVSRDSVDAAHTLLAKNRDDLQHYLDEKEFASIGAAVASPYQQFRKKRREARLAAYRLGRMIRWGRPDEAHRESKKYRADMAKYLTPRQYDAIRVKVRDSYKAYVLGQRAARKTFQRIDALVSQGEVIEAHALFESNHSHLKRYLARETYDGLDARVNGPYRELRASISKAASTARTIEGLIGKGRAWDAYENFRTNRHLLEKYLDKPGYEALRAKVYAAYKGDSAAAP